MEVGAEIALDSPAVSPMERFWGCSDLVSPAYLPWPVNSMPGFLVIPRTLPHLNSQAQGKQGLFSLAPRLSFGTGMQGIGL